MVAALATLSDRKKIRVNGAHSIADVARTVCGDVRLAALLMDMNPTLAASGVLPAGTVVVCPGKAEAQAFAKKMGFTLGFDARAPNGSVARRKWQQLQGGGARAAASIDGDALARSLLEAGVTAAEAGKRVAKLCGEAALASLLSSSDVRLKQVGVQAELQLLYPRALSRITAVKSILDATSRPGGMVCLLEVLAAAPAEGKGVLGASAVAPALQVALAEEAPRVCGLISRARSLAALERGARDATLAADEDGVGLAPLVAAIVDGVDPLGGERCAAVGIGAEAQALLKHLEMLRGALKNAEAGLGRAPPEVIRAIARGEDAVRLPRPWPLLGTVCKELGARLESAPATARDLGLGGLVKRKTIAPRLLSVAELQSRAASCARAADEGAAFVERLAPVVLELFGWMRPAPAVDGGTPQARRARQKMAFDLAIAARGDVSGAGITTMVRELLERARLAGHPAALRLSRAQVSSLEQVASSLDGALTVQRQPLSELGRALVLAAMALDRELGQALSRPTGREAFATAAMRHAGRVISAAACHIGA